MGKRANGSTDAWQYNQIIVLKTQDKILNNIKREKLLRK